MSTNPAIEIELRSPELLEVILRGDFENAIPNQQRAFELLLRKLAEARPALSRVSFVAIDLGAWDSPLAAFLYQVIQQAELKGIEVDLSHLPDGLIKLLTLAAPKIPVRADGKQPPRFDLVQQLGRLGVVSWQSILLVFEFMGECFAATWRLLTGRAHLRSREFFQNVDECGPQALPIVTLISVLVGTILAFIGAVQLRRFGAQIYVANLVAVAMLRELGAVMAAVIMAGRTGAAFAASLGTMQVNQETDALKTFGIAPVEFLVLPRLIALTLMLPLLCLYADLMGILGGALIGGTFLDISPALYFHQTRQWLHLSDLWFGVGKSIFFGGLVALCGCFQGMKCKRSAEAVGHATTKAVVTGIVWIVVFDGLFAVFANVFNI